MGLFGGFSILNPATGGTGSPGQVIINDYTSTGTWACCPGVQLVEVITIGGGGGGGNGVNFNCNVQGYLVLGGAGGGGGGISQTRVRSCTVGPTACVVVGAGNPANGNPGQGYAGASCFYDGLGFSVCAGGGQDGGRGACATIYGVFPSPQLVTNGGVGGAGTVSAGNDGGAAFYRCNPFTVNGLNGEGKSGSNTRGGGGGGSAVTLYCNGAAGSPSTAESYCGISLTDYGQGGNGGNSTACGTAQNGGSGNGGFVRVIQYY
jgi:hypothetical protein